MNMNIAKVKENESPINYDNFFCTNKPMSLSEAQIYWCVDKGIEGHIIICGIVPGIKNLILPLRPRLLDQQRRPIVILSNESLGEENVNGDNLIWKEINKFEEIYIIRGSALNPNDLERARISKAKAIVILSKPVVKNTEDN